MEKYTKHAVQDVQLLVLNRSMAGAVYELVEPPMEVPPIPVVTMSTDTSSRKRVREEIGISQSPNPTSPTTFPPDKRQPGWERFNPRFNSFNIGPNTHQPKPQVQARTPHIPMDLPADFQAAPEFNFHIQASENPNTPQPSETQSWNFPRQELPEFDGLDVLMEAMLSPTQAGSKIVTAEQSPLRPQSLLQRFNDAVQRVISPLKSPSQRDETADRPKRIVRKPHLYQSEEEVEKEKEMKKKS